MKRTYITPVTETEKAMPQQILAGSVKGKFTDMSDQLDIGYGGVDEDGSLDPSSNSFKWDSENWDKL